MTWWIVLIVGNALWISLWYYTGRELRDRKPPRRDSTPSERPGFYRRGGSVPPDKVEP